MKKSTTSSRIKQIMLERGLRQVDILEACKPYCKKYGIKLEKNDLSQYISGKVQPKQDKLSILGLALNVSEVWLMGYDVSKTPKEKNGVNVTENYTTFPILGDVPAGYDGIASEDWEGDTIDIPDEWLRGRQKNDYFVLRVKGDSMFPTYQDGDKVLILKQSTLNYSGQVGVILYDDESTSLKKVEYKMGEDWLRMVPINPSYPIKRVEGEQLTHCRILGIPKKLIRDIED